MSEPTGSDKATKAKVKGRSHCFSLISLSLLWIVALTSWVQVISHLTLLGTWDYICMLPCLTNFWYFCRDVISHVAQAGLELLSSSNPPTSASKSVRIT
ncbi:UPF0764 protein C16orf89, partial [Plecturocebus cupreus]